MSATTAALPIIRATATRTARLYQPVQVPAHPVPADDDATSLPGLPVLLSPVSPSSAPSSSVPSASANTGTRSGKRQDASMSRQRPALDVRLARSDQDIAASQALRTAVFAAEFGVQFDDGQDSDPLDQFCAHLLVWDGEQLVGTARLLDRERARQAGRFYSEQDFHIQPLLQCAPGNIMEVGRVCIDPAYRNLATISHLWRGMALQATCWQATHLMGCASIPLGNGDIQGWLDQLPASQLIDLPIRSRRQLPVAVSGLAPRIPPLLAAYLRMNARLGRQACFDGAFHCADVLVWLPMADVSSRYRQHFASALQAPPDNA